MKPKEYRDYQEFTRTTAIYPKDCEREYLVLGLVSEAGELSSVLEFEAIPNHIGRWLPGSQEDFVKEAGDVFWYVARLCDAFGLEFADCVTFAIDFLEKSNVKSFRPKEDLDKIVQLSCELCGIQKKVLRDRDGLWSIGQFEKLFPILKLISLNLIRLLHTYGSNLECCLEANREKLCDRKSRDVLSGSGDDR